MHKCPGEVPGQVLDTWLPKNPNRAFSGQREFEAVRVMVAKSKERTLCFGVEPFARARSRGSEREECARMFQDQGTE